ncbi:MAG: hypothetical protein H6837_05795 [Planctomycetes bacterium]|nr:hypothetical protein [Planctomycetota bacterium]
MNTLSKLGVGAPVDGDDSEAGGGSGATAESDGGDSKRGARRRRKKRGRGPGSGPSVTGHANDAVRALSDMVRQVLENQGVHFLSRPRHLDLRLSVPLDVRTDGARAASRLVDSVLKLVEDVRANDRAMAPGSVYCYFSESAEAEGCRPTEPRLVFDGYGSTGRPKFSDFVTMAIERKTPGIDGLLAGSDVTLTHVTQGRVLRTAQLAEFGKGSPVFRVLGQVDAGLFAVRGQEAKAAFSFQVLLGTDMQGKKVLRLHPVGQCDVANLVDHSVPQILFRFQGDLDEAALRLQGLLAKNDEVDEEDFVLPLLQDLAKRLADRSKHRSRRTEHADQRSAKSTRPTAKAYEDAQQVADNDILFDEQDGTIVVVGRGNRAHVFTLDGKHVTSLANMHRNAVQQRIRNHRWRTTQPEERGEFRMQLRAIVKSHRDEVDRSDGGGGSRRRGKGPRGAPAQTEPGHLQAKIAQLMSGLGGGAAKAPPPAAQPAPEPAEAPPSAAAEHQQPDAEQVDQRPDGI